MQTSDVITYHQHLDDHVRTVHNIEKMLSEALAQMRSQISTSGGGIETKPDSTLDGKHHLLRDLLNQVESLSNELVKKVGNQEKAPSLGRIMNPGNVEEKINLARVGPGRRTLRRTE